MSSLTSRKTPLYYQGGGLWSYAYTGLVSNYLKLSKVCISANISNILACLVVLPWDICKFPCTPKVKKQRVRLDKDWIVPTRWSWITELPLVGHLNITMCIEVCRSNRGSAMQWERVGKYQPYPVRPFSESKFHPLNGWEAYDILMWLDTHGYKY